MRGLFCDSLGSIDGLMVRDAADLHPAVDEVVVDVRAASANFPDLLLVQGLYQVKPALPFSPGSELAGVVREVGSGVTRFAVGDRVMAYTGTGGFATQARVPEHRCVSIPASMPFDIAASLLLTYCTSHHALVDRGRVSRGDRILVLAAAGGVGLAALQIGKAKGAQVIAAASTAEKLAACREEGADGTIDTTREDPRTAFKEGGGFDVVFDPVGGDLTESALRAIRPRGRVLIVGFASGTIPKLPLNLPLLKECEVVGVQWGVFAMREPQGQAAVVDDLLRMWERGEIRPRIHRRYSLFESKEALSDPSLSRS